MEKHEEFKRLLEKQLTKNPYQETQLKAEKPYLNSEDVDKVALMNQLVSSSVKFKGCVTYVKA